MSSTCSVLFLLESALTDFEAGGEREILNRTWRVCQVEHIFSYSKRTAITDSSTLLHRAQTMPGRRFFTTNKSIYDFPGGESFRTTTRAALWSVNGTFGQKKSE